MTAKDLSYKKRNKSNMNQDLRAKNNLTTAPQRLDHIASANDSAIASDQTMGHIVSPLAPLKPQFFQPELSVFSNKRNTVQPSNMKLELNQLRDPGMMSQAARKALAKSGCQKEQKKQYDHLINEQTKTNEQLRQQIMDKASEQKKKLLSPKNLLKAEGRGPNASLMIQAQHIPMTTKN